jgi:hypothetical protein
MEMDNCMEMAHMFLLTVRGSQGFAVPPSRLAVLSTSTSLASSVQKESEQVQLLQEFASKSSASALNPDGAAVYQQ